MRVWLHERVCAFVFQMDGWLINGSGGKDSNGPFHRVSIDVHAWTFSLPIPHFCALCSRPLCRRRHKVPRIMTPPSLPAKSAVYSTPVLASEPDSPSLNQRVDGPPRNLQAGVVQSKEGRSEGVAEESQRKHGQGVVTGLDPSHPTNPRDDDDHHPSYTFPPLLPAKHTPPLSPTMPLTSSPTRTAAPIHMPQVKGDTKIEPDATEARLSHRLVLALKSKPTLTRTWEKKTFTAELRTAPLGDSIQGTIVEDLAGFVSLLLWGMGTGSL